MLLAIDTSTSLASIALVEEPAAPMSRPCLLVEQSWEVGQRHSVELLQRIEWLLASRNASMMRLTALAVATGPGSFNGVRVAVTTAKALGFALGLPVSAHPTLDVIAWGAQTALPAQGVVWALLDAGRGEIYAARYTPYSEADTRLWGPSKPPDIQVGVEDPVEARYYVLTPARLAELLARDGQAGLAPALCGEWRAETYVALEAALTELGVRARIDDTPRRAWSLAELALMRLATQREALASVEALAALEPSYLRRPAITTSTKRALGQSNQSGQREQEPEQDYEEGATHAVRG